MDTRGDGSVDAEEGSDGRPERVNFAVNVENGETVITMRGDRDTAVIVRSAAGERIYLPPEDFDREASGRDDSAYQSDRDDSAYQPAHDESPYRGARASPYRGVEDESPYQAARQGPPKEGLVPTADGYRIRHPEPATDVRLLR
ncbi:DUF7510 family protein [Halobellus sp. GM3]|uniref:DUF7510 family protein n=1 Tax=Halobellus sp. GM3 TaxID=3458410 RepID=UPI00403D6EF4